MSETQNPMLIDPNLVGQFQVPKVVGHTDPFPVEKVKDAKHYRCSMPNHSFFREDGKKLIFVKGHYETDDAHDIKYLDRQINDGTPYISTATSQEVNTYLAGKNPEKYMEDKLRPQIEAETADRLSFELQQTLEDKLKNIGVELSGEQLDLLKQQFGPRPPVVDEAFNQSLVDDKKLKGLDALSKLRGQQTPAGNNTLTQISSGQLGGIVGTDKIVNAAGSGPSDSSSNN